MKKGFTLVEFLLYIGIVSVILVALTLFLVDIISSRGKADAIADVQYSARFAMDRIVREIRNAIGINVANSIFDQPNGRLSLQTSNPSTNPTVIDLSETLLQIKQGTNPAYFLTLEGVEVNKLVFSNFSEAGKSGNVRITLGISHKNLQGRSDLEASTTLQTSVSLRYPQ